MFLPKKSLGLHFPLYPTAKNTVAILCGRMAYINWPTLQSDFVKQTSQAHIFIHAFLNADL